MKWQKVAQNIDNVTSQFQSGPKHKQHLPSQHTLEQVQVSETERLLF